MKKLILNENKYNILLEYAGFVNGWQKLINYIGSNVRDIIKNNLIKYGIDLTNPNKKAIARAFYNNENVDNDSPIDDFIINEEKLNKLGVYKIKCVVVSFRNSENNIASFNPMESYITSDNKLSEINIYVNPIYVIVKDKIEDALQHELSHAYEFMRRYKKNGVDKTDMNISNHYYNSNGENIVNKMSYYLSKIELNANISELYYSLERQKANTSNFRKIVMESNIYDVRNTILDMKEKILNDNSYILEILEFIKLNPEHADMFPTVKSNNVETYKKRIIRVLDYKINYINTKVNRLLKAYFKNNNK